jgi:cyclic pyranopterin phosphate synthase
MVDVSAKVPTARSATARAVVTLPPVCRRVLAAGGDTKKGNVFQVARIAGIQAAKRTHELIPLCHPLLITGIDLDLRLVRGRVVINATVRVHGPTGVEMEALTAASVAALTVYDMLKALSHDLIIGPIELITKAGGKRGTITRTPSPLGT